MRGCLALANVSSIKFDASVVWCWNTLSAIASYCWMILDYGRCVNVVNVGAYVFFCVWFWIHELYVYVTWRIIC